MSVRTLACIKEFRNNVVGSLIAANITGIGANVASSRTERAWPEEEAFICVYLPSVNFDDKRTSPRFYVAEGQLFVDVYARAYVNGDGVNSPDSSGEVNDFLDDTVKAVVEALSPIEKREGPYNGLVKRFVLKSMDNNLSQKGETERGSVRITFGVEFTACVTYGGPADLFCTAKNTLKMGGGLKNKVEFDTVVQETPPAPPEPDEPEENTET